MDRRRLLAAGGAFTAFSGLAFSKPIFSGVADLRTAARDAWLYCLPLVEMATTRSRMLGPEPTGMKAMVNGFVQARQLAGPPMRTVTTPNNDTLYSSAWLDLAAGPARATIT